MGYAHNPVDWFRLPLDAAFGIGAMSCAAIAWHRKHSARHWPITYGTVEFGISTDENNRWITDLSYSYKVNAEFYSGRVVLPAKDETHADELILRWKGQSITVRYSPKNPLISVIRMEDQQSLIAQDLRKSTSNPLSFF